jgi:hypothetical protein
MPWIELWCPTRVSLDTWIANAIGLPQWWASSGGQAERQGASADQGADEKKGARLFRRADFRCHSVAR